MAEVPWVAAWPIERSVMSGVEAEMSIMSICVAFPHNLPFLSQRSFDRESSKHSVAIAASTFVPRLQVLSPAESDSHLQSS